MMVAQRSLALLALAAVATAQVTVIEDFDALALGSIVGQNGWQSLSSPGGNPTVVTAATGQGLRWTGGGGTHMKIFKSSAFSIPAGVSTFSFSFSVISWPHWGASVCIGRTGVATIVSGTAQNTNCDLLFGASAQLSSVYIVLPDGTQVNIPGALPSNTQVTLQVNSAINGGLGCISVYYGSTLVLDKANAGLNSLPSTWDLLAIDWEASPDAIYMLDSFQWEQLSETNCDHCDELDSEWLVTEYMPELDVAATGFNVPATKDEFLIVFTYHRKYFDVVPSSGALSQASGAFSSVSVAEYNPLACWDTYTVQVSWADLVTECHRAEEGGASGFVVFTCKIEVDAKEHIDPIRDNTLIREIHNEIPFTIRFPKQVSASVSNLSAFQPPNVLAAIIRQEVSLDVAAVTDVDAKIRLFTSTQYPFTLDPASATLVSLPAAGGITFDSFANVVDCTHPNTPDEPNKPVDDSLACSQEWLLDVQVNAADRCDIDGEYKVNFRAVCYSTFQSDCPLVKDDQGVFDDIFEVTFVIDSEDFCAQVVDTVDVAAVLAVYKDHAHSVSASNFIHGQTAYFVATASSNKVTIVGLSVDDIDVDVTGAPSAGHHDFYTDGVANAANPAAIALAVENSGAAGVPDNQAWFQWVVSDPPFAAPVDGSSDFNVDVTLNVLFKDATGLLSVQRVRLLQDASSQQFGANTEFKMTTGGDDDETAAAASVSFGVTAVVGAALLAVVA